MKPKQASVREEYNNKAHITNTKQFLFKKRANKLSAYIKKGTEDSRECTHRLLDGGNLHLDKSEMDEFYKQYATDLATGQKNYIVELRTPIFRYYIDMDIFDHEYYTGKKLQKIIIKIQKALSHFFQRNKLNGDVYVCTTPMKKVTKTINDEKQEFVKTGVHLIYPFVYVNQTIALFLREFIVQYLKANFGSRSEHNDWDDVIDETVYKDNGLRMLGSFKAEICKACRNKETLRDACDMCYGYGRLFGKHTYKLEYILSDHKTLKMKECAELLRKQSEMIQLLSIRTNKFKTNVDISEPYPAWFNVNTASKGDKKVNGVLKRIKSQLKKMGGCNGKNIDDKEKLDAITKSIKETFGSKKYYKDIDILYARHNPHTKVLSYWAVSNSTYCCNVDREHNSSTIYFEIKYDGIVQRCFCKKTSLDGRKGTTCGKFKSASFDVPQKYKKILFPEQHKEKVEDNPLTHVGGEKKDGNLMDVFGVQKMGDINLFSGI